MKVFSADMEQLLTNIESRVETYGQDDAVRSGARQLRNVVRQTSRNGIAIVVNMGGAGTGKTSTGEALAREAGIPSLYVSMENYSDETKMNDIDNSGRGYVGSDRPETTLLGRIFKMPVLKMVLFDEWEKAYQEVAKKFVSAWDSGKMDWNGQPRSLKGTIFWITTNQGQMFPEYLAQALALHDQIKKNGTVDGLNLELPQALREKLKTGAPNVPAEELKTQLHALLTEMNMTEMQLNEIASAQGDYRDGLESAAAGRYLHHIDSVRWPKEILSRITVLFYKPHTEESISLVVEKFIRQFRKDMRNDLKVRVYVDDEAIEQLKKSYNKDTGARPIEISLRDLFSDVIYKTMPDIDLNADVIEIGVEGGRFVANKVNKSDMFKAMVAGMRNMKEIASETDLAKEDRKIRSGIVTRSVREALRSAR
jgi:ATP-dependent Clp protease ATP-binding subunit ClpA